MKGVEYNKPKGIVFSIMSDGKFHTTVPDHTPGAIIREYETTSGAKGVKYEHIADAISGTISNISLFESEYGKQIVISLDQGEDLKTIYLSTNSPFGEDFMKKLPNIKPDKPVRLVPFAIENENKKVRKGITIYQGDPTGDKNQPPKISDYYHTKDGDKILSINGYPAITGDTTSWDSDDWKLYFMQARKFLIEQTQKYPLYNKNIVENKMDYPTAESEGIDPNSVPF